MDLFVVDHDDVVELINKFNSNICASNVINIRHQSGQIRPLIYDHLFLPIVILDIIIEYAVNTLTINYKIKNEYITKLVAKNIVFNDITFSFDYNLSMSKQYAGLFFTLLSNGNEHVKYTCFYDHIPHFNDYMNHTFGIQNIFGLDSWIAHEFNYKTNDKGNLIIICGRSDDMIVIDEKVLTNVIVIISNIIKKIISCMPNNTKGFYL